jgi:hypothetical protein
VAGWDMGRAGPVYGKPPNWDGIGEAFQSCLPARLKVLPQTPISNLLITPPLTVKATPGACVRLVTKVGAYSRSFFGPETQKALRELTEGFHDVPAGTGKNKELFHD